jgi:hypothetical protein
MSKIRNSDIFELALKTIGSMPPILDAIVDNQLQDHFGIIKYKQKPSFPVDYPKLMHSPIWPDHSQYLSILAVIVDPSLPLCPVIPFVPMSVAWSQAALVRPSSHSTGLSGDCFFKNSIHSKCQNLLNLPFTTSAPSDVDILTLPGKAYIFPLKY